MKKTNLMNASLHQALKKMIGGVSRLPLFQRLTRSVGLFLLIGSVCVADPVRIDFFYEPGCHQCEQVEEVVFPALEQQFPSQYVIFRHDIGVESNFVALLRMEEALGYAGAERAYLIVGKRYVFGPEPNWERLRAAIIHLQYSAESGEARSVAMRDCAPAPILTKRYLGFTWSAVFVAGLLDGINPCAISTLVFFMSLLAVSKIQKRQLLLVGASFCLASFATYLALGFGLLRVLHLLSNFERVRHAVEWSLGILLLFLALLSFRDAVRFRKTHAVRDVSLQLSTNMKKRIHNLMRRGLRTRSLVLGGLLIGAGVTALESICTGQVYVPTLVLILKSRALSDTRAWVLLLGYNALFVAPLLLAFAAVYWGLQTQQLLRWSRKNVAWSKVLLGLFFALSACLILFK